MSSSGSGRHVGRVLVTILSVMVLLTTVVGAGVTVVKGQLESNIPVVDVDNLRLLGECPKQTKQRTDWRFDRRHVGPSIRPSIPASIRLFGLV